MHFFFALSLFFSLILNFTSEPFSELICIDFQLFELKADPELTATFQKALLSWELLVVLVVLVLVVLYRADLYC